MRVLLANLKLFYQCRVLWLVYLLVASFLVVSGGFDLRMRSVMGGIGFARGAYFTWMGLVCAIGLAVGTIAASVQMEVLPRPFSFCLPNHRAVLRRFIFLVGLMVTVVVSLLWPAKNVSASLSPVYFSGVIATAYFIGVSIGLTFRGAVMGFVLLLILFLPMGGSTLDRKASTELAVATTSATATIMLGAVSASAVWWWLGRTDLFRRCCGRPWLGLLGLWNPTAKENYRLAHLSARVGRTPRPTADGFLLNRTRDCEDRSTAKYVCGAFYTWLLPGGGGRCSTAWNGCFGLVSAVLAWYMPSMAPFFIVNAAVLAWIPGSIPLRSPLLVAGGRRERFFTTMASVVVLGIIVTLSITVAFSAMDLMEGHTILGWVRIEAPKSSLYMKIPPMNLRLVILLTALFPIARLSEIKLGGTGFGVRIARPIVFLPSLMLAMHKRALLMTISPTCVALAFVLSWIACTYGVYRTAMRSDLGRK
jgi:hypothetical protein